MHALHYSVFVPALLLLASTADAAPRRYADLSLQEVERQLRLLSAHSSLLRVTDAHARFGLPPVSWREVTCSPLIARATDHETLGRDNERPQVLLSGALHGDERVGPAAVTETIRLLLHAAMCDAPGSAMQADVLGTGLDDVCDSTDVRTRDWLWHLLTSRDIFALPAANCVGYALLERREKQIDPNRDFPFEQSPDKCMKTTTARVFNELWRANLFQLAVTFHGGMEAISWVWGSPSHPSPHDVSPDEVAQAQIGRALQRAAGTTTWGRPYQMGRMSSLVYPVPGGMEDWAYGAGWANQQPPCKNSDYDPARTVYSANDPSFRTAIYLVESSNQKTPPAYKYGHFGELFNATSGSGHVTRDIRLTLMALEMVQPYVCLDAVSLRQHQHTSSFLRSSRPTLHVAWYVGGALKVEDTFLTLQPAPKKSAHPCIAHSNCTMSELRSVLSLARQSATRRLRAGGADEHEQNSAMVSRRFRGGFGWKNPALVRNATTDVGGFPMAPEPFQPMQSLFTADVDLHGKAHSPGDYWIVAWAKVDEAWGRRAAKAQPSRGPQTHLANGRTSPGWTATRGDRVVNGRLFWHSAPVAFRVTDSGSIDLLSWTLRCRYSMPATTG